MNFNSAPTEELGAMKSRCRVTRDVKPSPNSHWKIAIVALKQKLTQYKKIPGRRTPRDPQHYDITISRKGQKLNTEYSSRRRISRCRRQGRQYREQQAERLQGFRRTIACGEEPTDS
jgi:hypothetical protein